MIAESSARLIAASQELDALSKTLVGIERELEPLEERARQHRQDMLIALWTKHTEEGEKHPPAETRDAIIDRAMEPTLWGQLVAYRSSRTRAKQRLSDLREVVAAHRSIVSAAKTELEASEGPKPQTHAHGAAGLL